MTPYVIEAESFQQAWYRACGYLLAHGGEAWNLTTHTRDPVVLDDAFHHAYASFCSELHLLAPRHVAYTIFPAGLARGRSAQALSTDFNRPGGFYDRVYRKLGRWGTYFRRMTHYSTNGQPVNQLLTIIRAISERENSYKAAYSIVIQCPGWETAGPRGHPCLNYLAFQVVPGSTPLVHLLAVYRNHDFTERAYGNYQGLGQLLSFVAGQTDMHTGTLTCYSSHAEISRHRRALRELLADLQSHA